MSKGFMSIEQVAARWSCHANTARRILAASPRTKIGGMIRYSLEEIERIEEDGLQEPETPRARPAPPRESVPGVTELRRRYGL